MVLSAVVVFGVTLIRSLRAGKKQALLRGGACLALIAACGILEWALDKTPVSNLLLYAAMAACCAAMIVNGMRGARPAK